MKKYLFINKGIVVVVLLVMAVVGYACCNVDIDIKPNNTQNKINPDSHGKVTVAILTTCSFDATTVNPTTVRFGALSRRSGAYAVSYDERDVDGDGDIDMSLQFNTDETGIQQGDTEAGLAGETDQGESFGGDDYIQTVGN